MKTVLRAILLNSLSIWLTSLISVGLTITGGIPTILMAGAVLFLIQNLIKPVLQIITLPFNVLTLGLFSWVVNIIVLYLLTLFIGEIRVSPFTFQGINYGDFVISKLEINQFSAFILASLALKVMRDFLEWAAKR